MKNQRPPLNIPVPPEPILEQAVGFQNDRNVRYLALWWEPAGDEAMLSDGFVTFTGHWPGYMAFIHHKSIQLHLAIYNLGSSDEPAEYRLVVDLLERKAYIAKCKEAEMVLGSQRYQEITQTKSVSVTSEEIEALIQSFVVEIETLPSMEDLLRLMEEDQKAVDAHTGWLDNQQTLIHQW